MAGRGHGSAASGRTAGQREWVGGRIRGLSRAGGDVPGRPEAMHPHLPSCKAAQSILAGCSPEEQVTGAEDSLQGAAPHSVMPRAGHRGGPSADGEPTRGRGWKKHSSGKHKHLWEYTSVGSASTYPGLEVGLTTTPLGHAASAANYPQDGWRGHFYLEPKVTNKMR